MHTMPKLRRTLTRTVPLLLVGVTAAWLSAFAPPSARAAAPRTLTISPATGVGDQVVQVHWTGFTPTDGFNNTVTIVQCKADPHSIDADNDSTTADDCYTAAPPLGNEIAGTAITQANGTGSASIEILPAAQLPMLNCSETNPCSLVAYENDGTIPPADSLPATAAVAPIQFAKSIDDCPPVENFDVRAEGEASATTLIDSWAANLCTATPPTILDYTETSSNSGREDYLNKLVDVGITSMPPTAAELAAAPGYPKYVYAPIDLSAVVVAYNMADGNNGTPLDNLVLSPRLLARVISDTNLGGGSGDPTSFWGDPELNQLNPGVTWPTEALSQPLLRAEHNADTYITTDWIAHNSAAEKFLQGNDPDGIAVNDSYKDIAYPTDEFQNVESAATGYLPIQGETQVARKLFYAVKPAETTPNTPSELGFIGVLDLPTAMRYGLPTAKLVNASGAAVAPDAAGIAAGYKEMVTNPDGVTKYPNFATTDAAAYPLVKVDYAMIPTVVKTAAQAASLKRFLDFVATTGQQNLPLGYAALPADLVAQVKAAEAAITVAGAAPTTTTTTPTTTTPTTTPVSDLGPISDGTGFSSGTGGAATTTPPVTVATTTPKPKKAPVKSTKLARVTPVVDIANPGERFGLPIIAALALLGALYPLGRRARPSLRKVGAVARSRMRGPKTPAAGSVS
jgi:ABC-type phosphate transport system substrate-binding protein